MAGKVKYNSLSEAERKRYLGDFYSMVSMLDGREEIKNFFKDLLTLSEITMISRRIQIAKSLLEGKSYELIRRELGAGFSTINHVEKWLNEGFGGYKTVINKYDKKMKTLKTSHIPNEPFSRGWVKKKYPLHYLLSNLAGKK